MSRRRLRRRGGVADSVGHIVMDSGGLTAVVGRSQRARAMLRWIVERGGSIHVPSPVLVETITGDAGHDAEINRVLGVLQQERPVVVAPDEATARHAGRLRFEAGADDGIDALVAAAAAGIDGRCLVLTSDPDDLERLLALEKHVVVRAV